MDFKCSWKDVNVLIQDSAFIGHSLTEIRAALAALTASIVLAQTAVILKPWSRPNRSHLPKGNSLAPGSCTPSAPRVRTTPAALWQMCVSSAPTKKERNERNRSKHLPNGDKSSSRDVVFSLLGITHASSTLSQQPEWLAERTAHKDKALVLL